MTAPENLAGTHIGPFRLERFLARGAMGQVYKAYDTVLLRPVALKIISRDELPGGCDEQAMREEASKRLVQEAKAAGRLNHPNVVTIYSYGRTDTCHYICMEYVTGKTVTDVLHEIQRLNVDDAVQVAKQVLLALKAANAEHIVHRDIKPSNIMITARGGVKVMDFGIARLPSCASTTAGTVLGTPYYMSPEQVTGQAVDTRSDLFSLGTVLYQMLTGRLPFEGESTATITYNILHAEPIPIDSINDCVPRPLTAIVSKSLKKDPALRYQTPEEMLDDLDVLANAANLAIYSRSETTVAVEKWASVPEELQPDAPPHHPPDAALDASEDVGTEAPPAFNAPIPLPHHDDVASAVRALETISPTREHHTVSSFRSWMAAHRFTAVGVALTVVLGLIAAVTFAAFSLLSHRLPPAQTSWMARLKGWMPAFPGSPPYQTQRIEGHYIVDGFYPNGGHYRGTAAIGRTADYYAVSWNIANQVFTGNGILNGTTLLVSWAGAGTSGIVTYTLRPDGVLQGYWADRRGSEALIPSR
ncbi:MAG: serine/threonine-protein kinase [Syntrophobacteraceae bacterium]